MVSIVKGICCKFLVIEDDIYCMQRGKLEANRLMTNLQ